MTLTRWHTTLLLGLQLMQNSRILLSVFAFLSAVMVIWMLVSVGVLEPLNVATLSPLKFAYFAFVFACYVCFWVYFYRRPRGSRIVLDGRTALSVSAFIVGGVTGYALIELGIFTPLNTKAALPGSIAIFVACTLLPIVIWLAVYAKTLRNRKAALRRFMNS